MAGKNERIKELEAGLQSLSKFHGKTEEDVLKIIEDYAALQGRIDAGVEFEISRSDGGAAVYMTRPSSGIQAKLHAIWFHEIQPGEKRKAHIVLAEKE